ncbi:MAG: D-glycero-beta-D-manno-heptose 1,7-bisphosphate 7-phosphatase [Gammaproteobacteria bacterium]|nr:D-glycero-beta-D-manno-heptose 1,7-bisphosphate 7-phosphatase [Gammaproteobacteria bacterium]
MKLLILDRDGVINEDSESYIKSPDEWQPIAGSLQAIVALNRAGLKVAVVTNQSGLARGLFSIDDLNAIHQKMRKELDKLGGHIDALFFCPHGPDDNCECRKPKSGLLKDALSRFHTPAEEALLIGDSLRDLEAADSLGIPRALVLTGNGQQTLDNLEDKKGLKIFPDLQSAVADYL